MQFLTEPELQDLSGLVESLNMVAKSYDNISISEYGTVVVVADYNGDTVARLQYNDVETGFVVVVSE